MAINMSSVEIAKSMLRLEAGGTEPLPGVVMSLYCSYQDRNSKNPLTRMAHTGYMTHMRKQFEKRARLAIYLENSDLQRLTAKARAEGKLLAEWARETLLGELGGNSEVRSKPAIRVAGRGAAELERISGTFDESLKAIKVCRHGLSSCTICG